MFTQFPTLGEGPLAHFFELLLIAIGIYHFTLSVRILIGRRRPVSAGVHAVLLFSGPCLVVLLILFILLTTMPGYFVNGLDQPDTPEYIRGCVHQAAMFSIIGFFCFVPNLLLAIPSVMRSERSS